MSIEEKNGNAISNDAPKTGSIFSKNWSMEDGGNDVAHLENAPADVCIPAILALGCGLISFLVFLSYNFYFLPALTVILSLVSFIMIKKSGGKMVGKTMILIALAFTIIPSVAVPTMKYVYQRQFLIDARQYGDFWFKFALKGDFQKVKTLEHSAHIARSSSNESKYWIQYIGDPEMHEQLHKFLSNDLLLTLAALGDKAKVTFYKKSFMFFGTEDETIRLIYAITYPGKQDKKETFFVGLNMSRYKESKHKIAIWKGGDKLQGPLPLDENGEPIYIPK